MCICGGDNEMSSKGATTAAVSMNHELRLVIEVKVKTAAGGDVEVEAGLRFELKVKNNDSE